MKITHIDAYQIFDSRGQPTVEAVVRLSSGLEGFGLVPSGASTGQFEAIELRDNNLDRFLGKSVFQAVQNIQELIAPVVVGLDVEEQALIDRRMIELDGTSNKSRLGANAILGVSLAVANAAAKQRNLPVYASLEYPYPRENLIPLPEIQLVGGGAHAQWRTDVQDFLLIANGADTYEQTLEATYCIYMQAMELLKQRGLLAGIADEGGFWPVFNTHEEIFEFVLEAIQQAGYQPGKDVSISLDIAASDFYRDGKYHFRLEERSYSSEEFLQLMLDWCARYPIISIEDPFADTDHEPWKAFVAKIGKQIQVIGDDLFTTNIQRIRYGIEHTLANSVLVKLNQIGSVTETIDAIKVTQDAGWLPVVSARSGETEDAFISHLAVATNAGQLKVGAFARSERMVKWNELIRIQRHLAGKAQFIGANIYKRLKQ